MLPAGKEASPEAFEDLIAARVSAFEISLSTREISLLARYLGLLDFWRRRTNLTGPFPAETLVEHAMESCLGADLLPVRAQVADIGSGAGLPGIPIAILRSDISLVPVEPRRKRREFLDRVRETLSIGPSPEAPRLLPAVASISTLAVGSCDAALARAVGSISQVLDAAPFLSPSGQFLAWTTDPDALARSLDGRFRLERVREVPASEKKQIAVFRRVPG
ncbi:MAG: RsmG family class I SAM-dependent methyltransferase [Acidobacteriota bacterium]